MLSTYVSVSKCFSQSGMKKEDIILSKCNKSNQIVHKREFQVLAKASPPERIAVVGAGPAGLSLAHALLTQNSGAKHVKVYEQYGELAPEVGGALNINGGAVMLAKMGLMKELSEIGNPMKRVVAQDTSSDSLFSVDVPSVLPHELKYCGQPCAFTVMRQDLQNMLQKQLPEGVISLSSRVKEVVETETGVRMVFENEELSPEEYDLVVGCDGIRSKVRSLVTGEGEPNPVYSGIRVIFAIAPPGIYPKESSDLLQWFGDGAYTLVYTGGVGETQRDIMAVCVADRFAVEENPDWTSGAGEVEQRCLDALTRTNMPQVCKDLCRGAERVFEVGVYYHRSLDSWSTDSSRVVLLGDAAHAMPPFMGQGANQAIQDSFCLATSLGKIGKDFETLGDAINYYESRRQPPTSAIMQVSRLNGFIETQGGAGSVLRNLLFKTLGVVGIPGQIFVQNAVPRV